MKVKALDMLFEGIYTPLVTPYKSDFSLNESALDDIVNALIDAGIHGIVVAGTTGEYYAQTLQERLALMCQVKDLIAGRVPLVVGTGAIRTEDSIVFAKRARDIGADAILIATPPYACPTGYEIAHHALAIDQAANLPVLLYNYPGRMSVNMDATCLDLLAQSPNFCAIKESSGDIDRLHMLACDYPRLQLSCGMDDQALEFFAWGAKSWVCAGSNFAPEGHIALYNACVVDGDFARGRQIMSAMMPLMRVLEQGGKFIQNVKHGLTLRGFEAGPPRKPLCSLDDDEEHELADVIQKMNVAIKNIEERG